MSHEGLWVATCLVGAVLTGVAVALGRREHLTRRVRVLIWVGPGLFLLGGVEALDDAHLSHRGRGLWLSGVAMIAALGVVALAAGRPEVRSLRIGATVLAGLCLVMFVLAVFDLDPLGAVLFS